MNESGFLDALYSAAATPSEWPAVMETFADMVGGSSAILSSYSIIDGRGDSIGARRDPEMRRLYVEHFENRNPLHFVSDPREYLKAWRPMVITDEDWMPKADLLRTEFYNDFLKPFDVHSHLMIRLACVGDKACVLNIQRPERDGQFDGENIERARRYHADLIRAFKLSLRLSPRQSSDVGLTSLFDGSRHAFFAVDAGLRVLRVNATGADLARAHRGLSVKSGRLHLERSIDHERLSALVARAADPAAEVRAGGSMALSLAQGGMPRSVTVAPAGDGALDVFGRLRVSLVCIVDLEGETEAPFERFQALFELTPAETRLASELFRGARVGEAAKSLRISTNTANVHLRRVFEKTSVNRQSALIALMMRVLCTPLD